jgi:hypothetical protein
MKKLLALTAAAILSIGSAHSAIVFGNLGSDGSGALGPSSFQISSTQYLAQGFRTPVSGDLLSLNSVVLGLNVNTGSSSTRVEIFGDVSGVPGGSALAQIDGSVPSTSSLLYTFTLNSPLLLANNSLYWVVVTDPDAGQAFNWVFNDDGISPTGLNGSGYTWPSPGTLRSTDSGLSWVNRSDNTERTAAFYLNVSTAEPIPEPGTWAAAALLVSGAAFMRWRRRKVA